jgi:hypothetical protein
MSVIGRFQQLLAHQHGFPVGLILTADRSEGQLLIQCRIHNVKKTPSVPAMTYHNRLFKLALLFFMVSRSTP